MVRLTDHPDMTLDVYRGRKTTTQQLTDANSLFKVVICGKYINLNKIKKI